MDDKYWEDLSKYPPMSKEEEKVVALKAKAGDKRARDLLINSNLRFVVDFSKEYQGNGLSKDDLIQYGSLGMCIAYDKFDPERNIKFISYAVWWVRQAILQALNDETHLVKIPNYQVVSKNMIEKTKEKLEQKYQRQISYAEVEEDLGKTGKKTNLASYSVIPLDKSYTTDGKGSLKDILPDANSIDPSAESEHESFLAELDNILSDFTPREREIVKMYHGIGIVRNMTLEEIGVDMGITRERVRQIKAKVLIKLRHKSRSDRLQPYLDILKSELLNDLSSK